MVWVEPMKTAGLASSLLWQTEDEIGGAGGEAARWAFEFQRHRLANAGALAGMRKRLEGGGMCVRRIVTDVGTPLHFPLFFHATQMQNVNTSCHWKE